MIPHLIAAGGGALVNVGPVASLRGYDGPAYAAREACLARFTRTISEEFGSQNVRCHPVSPGPVHTAVASVVEEKGRNILRPTTIPRLARPLEVAELISFLLSDAAKYLSGSMQSVDGAKSYH